MTVLGIDQIDRLLACAARAPGAYAERNRALVAVLAHCGLRPGEALALDVSDVRTEESTLAVRSGGAPRTISLPPSCVEDLRMWLGKRRDLPVERAAALFVTRTGSRLSASYVRQLLPRLARDADLSVSLSPESLRRSHARDLVRRGWPLHEVQRRLGYSTAAATRRFFQRAGLDAPVGAGAQDRFTDALMSGASPCRTCLHGDALDEASVAGVSDSLDAVLTLDSDGIIRSANPAAECLFASEPGGLVGESAFKRFEGPRHAWLAAACREGLATRRPARAVQTSAAGAMPSVLRAVPTAGGLTLWIRDELAQGGLATLTRQFSALALGAGAGTVAVLRALRGADGEVVDFVVAGVHNTRAELAMIERGDALLRNASQVLPTDVLPAFVERLGQAIETQAGSRFAVKLDRDTSAERTRAIRIVPLADEWVVVVVQDRLRASGRDGGPQSGAAPLRA